MSALIWLKSIIAYTYPAVSLFGLITNSISFVIFSRKRFQNTIFSTYFRLYLLFQTLNLILLPINKMLELNNNVYFSKISNFTCKLRFFYPNFNLANAAWLLIIISIDRYLSISHPTKFLFKKKYSFHSFVCSSIILFHIFYYVPNWFYYLKEDYKIMNNQTMINLTSIKSYKCVSAGVWVEIMGLLQQIMIPFILMGLFTVLNN